MLCQSIKREQWVDKLKNSLLHVPYVHMTFTLPHELNMLAKFNKWIIYDLIMKVAWKTICHIGQKQNITLGMTSVLHTFGSDTKYHIHVHALVTFGGVQSDGTWVYPEYKKKLERYRHICSVYKNLFLDQLRNEKLIEEIQYPQDYHQLIEEVSKKRWVVHSTYPTMDTDVIQNYLARYINRVAITPGRLTYIKEQQQVNIVYNDYTRQISGHPAPKSIKSLAPIDAIHQIMQHVLPPFFQKSRRYGLHHGSSKVKDKVKAAIKSASQTIRTIFEIIHQLLKECPIVCQDCGSINIIMQDMDVHDKNALTKIFIDSLPSPPQAWTYLFPYLLPAPVKTP